jgi:quinol monooxygenase YgiN
MSVTITVLFPTKADESERFYETLITALTETRAYDGCEGITTHRDLDDPSKIFMIEAWETRDKYLKYLAWREETGFIAALGPMLAGPPVIGAYSNTGD